MRRLSRLASRPRRVRLDQLTFPSPTMSKRQGGDSTRRHLNKVKKRRGVGSRTIIVPSSDEENPIPEAIIEYAQVTKTRVTTAGKAEKFTGSSVPVFATEEEVDIHAPLEADTDGPAETVAENDVPRVPAKKRKQANDSVSGLTLSSLRIAKSPSDQDVLLASYSAHRARLGRQPRWPG